MMTCVWRGYLHVILHNWRHMRKKILMMTGGKAGVSISVGFPPIGVSQVDDYLHVYVERNWESEAFPQIITPPVMSLHGHGLEVAYMRLIASF